MLFDSFEAYDVQETRRISREEGHREGREERLVEQVCKKIAKNYSVSDIAEMLEENEDTIQVIYDIAKEYAPEFDTETIMKKLQENREKRQ